METRTRIPDLRRLLPLERETRWSDLLAAMINTDPEPLVRVLGLADIDDPGCLAAHREAQAKTDGQTDYLDILVVNDSDPTSAANPVAVVEVKVLSGPGPRQLERYARSFPGAKAYRLVHLDGLGFGLSESSQWRSLPWSELLAAFEESADPWVATTALAWHRHVEAVIPRLGAATPWNAVPDDAEGFGLGVHARMCWLHDRITEWCGLKHDLVESAAGRSWVARIWADASVPHHLVSCEIEEGLSVRDRAEDRNRPLSTRMCGPSVWVGLRQENVNTSEGFDWDHLLRVFRETVLNDDGVPCDERNWRRTRPGLRDPFDKANWRQKIHDTGGPHWLGKGFGMAQAKGYGGCMFGARFDLPPTATLGTIDAEIRRLDEIIRAMSNVPAISAGS